jgi:hypothetical protein
MKIFTAIFSFILTLFKNIGPGILTVFKGIGSLGGSVLGLATGIFTGFQSYFV